MSPWKKSPDEQMMLLITWNCNAKCPGCVYEKMLGKMHMPMKTFTKASKSIGHFHEITIAGGEPTIHPKFWKMIEMVAARKPGWMQVITNGFAFSKTQRAAKEFLARMNAMATKAGVPILLRVSVDDFHARSLKGGAAELKSRVQNLLKVEPKKGMLELGFCASAAPRQSERALLRKYGLPKAKTYLGYWERGKSGGTKPATIIAPDGHVYARESHLVEGKKRAMGNIRKEPLHKIRRRRM